MDEAAVTGTGSGMEKQQPTDNQAIERKFCCQICFDLYSRHSRSPITLNCGHSFCRECLAKLGKRGRNSINCSICRRNTYSDWARLGKNIMLIELLEWANLLGEEEEGGKQAGEEAETHRQFDDISRFIVRDDIEEFNEEIQLLRGILVHIGGSEREKLREQIRRLQNDVYVVEQQMRHTAESFGTLDQELAQLQQRVHQAMPSGSSSGISDIGPIIHYVEHDDDVDHGGGGGNAFGNGGFRLPSAANRRPFGQFPSGGSSSFSSAFPGRGRPPYHMAARRNAIGRISIRDQLGSWYLSASSSSDNQNNRRSSSAHNNDGPRAAENDAWSGNDEEVILSGPGQQLDNDGWRHSGRGNHQHPSLVPPDSDSFGNGGFEVDEAAAFQDAQFPASPPRPEYRQEAAAAQGMADTNDDDDGTFGNNGFGDNGQNGSSIVSQRGWGNAASSNATNAGFGNAPFVPQFPTTFCNRRRRRRRQKMSPILMTLGPTRVHPIIANSWWDAESHSGWTEDEGEVRGRERGTNNNTEEGTTSQQQQEEEPIHAGNGEEGEVQRAQSPLLSDFLPRITTDSDPDFIHNSSFIGWESDFAEDIQQQGGEEAGEDEAGEGLTTARRGQIDEVEEEGGGREEDGRQEEGMNAREADDKDEKKGEEESKDADDRKGRG